jgi:dihydroorotate dehydrogenase
MTLGHEGRARNNFDPCKNYNDAILLYQLAKPLLFRLDPETAHDLTLKSLARAHRFGMLVSKQFIAKQATLAMGLAFPNPVGLAAGLDKNGAYIDALAALGFGFIEIGTVTPRPQPGNPRPRMFRLVEEEAIINRMGFNNQGVDQLIENVKSSRYRGILGINIGKNFDTPIECAADDYLACLEKIYEFASYITVNISSPNTKNLRQLQQETEFDALLAALKQKQKLLETQHGKYVPLAIKIAPDLNDAEIDMIADRLLAHRIDGVIATNTTLSRAGVESSRHRQETGGLSGKPLQHAATSVVRRLAQQLKGRIPIIGVGGIMSAAAAKEKFDAGATLIQIYSGLICRGPDLIRDILQT